MADQPSTLGTGHKWKNALITKSSNKYNEFEQKLETNFDRIRQRNSKHLKDKTTMKVWYQSWYHTFSVVFNNSRRLTRYSSKYLWIHFEIWYIFLNPICCSRALCKFYSGLLFSSGGKFFSSHFKNVIHGSKFKICNNLLLLKRRRVCCSDKSKQTNINKIYQLSQSLTNIIINYHKCSLQIRTCPRPDCESFARQRRGSVSTDS